MISVGLLALNNTICSPLLSICCPDYSLLPHHSGILHLAVVFATVELGYGSAKPNSPANPNPERLELCLLRLYALCPKPDLLKFHRREVVQAALKSALKQVPSPAEVERPECEMRFKVLMSTNP